MFFKPLKLKTRNVIINKEYYFESGNYFCFNINFHNFGLGFDYRLGDSRRFFTLDIMFIHFEIWF